MALELFPGKHLFVDDYRIEGLTAARRVLNQPRKHADNPIFRGENAWEAKGIHGHCLYDRERRLFRLWYTANGGGVVGTRVLGQDNPPFRVQETYICYAESEDAVHWQRPHAGIVEYNGSKDNNIIFQSLRTPGRASIQNLIDDPFEQDPQKRYKMMYLDQAGEKEAGSGLSPDQMLRLYAFSPDGIHWTRLPPRHDAVGRLFMVVRYLDETPAGTVDPDARYIIYGQRGSPWKTRQIGRRDSNDFLNWSENRPVLESSLRDTPGEELYYMASPDINQTYGGLHFGVLGAYYTNLSHEFNPARNHGVTEAQLAFSRDSVRWQRWREPLIPRGAKGTFDYGGVYCSFPAISEDCIHFFYNGESTPHGDKTSIPLLGLATMRLDGFVSVEAEGYMEGSLLTRPHHWKASDLRVNVQAAGGALRVQLQDETKTPVAGHTFADCDPVGEDTLDQRVTWQGRGDLSALRDRMVAVQFRFTPEVGLYSYTLTPG